MGFPGYLGLMWGWYNTGLFVFWFGDWCWVWFWVFAFVLAGGLVRGCGGVSG